METLISALDRQQRVSYYRQTRDDFMRLVEPLETEDFVVQTAAFVSPPKWHLAHTTWFFENFLLVPYKEGYQIFHSDYNYYFNSYYESQGDKVLRPNRGFMTRPTVSEIKEYREYVDTEMLAFLEETELTAKQQYIFEVGINHEQQHQELFFYDLKMIFGVNPVLPVYSQRRLPESGSTRKEKFMTVDEGLYEIGHDAEGFSYDNELKRHKVFLHSFEILDRVITNGEYLEFIKDGGYQNFEHWLADGWDWVNQNAIQAPEHWHQIEGEWYEFTLHGLRKVDPASPVTHVSYYEADAYASWRGMRLPTEMEWEVACQHYGPKADGNFADSGYYHPLPAKAQENQFLGSVWEWTASSYLPYPGFKKADGGLGEYNGKFMVDQMVLRGGSCATWKSHIRITYRNFFQPYHRWMFSGIRLAR